MSDYAKKMLEALRAKRERDAYAAWCAKRRRPGDKIRVRATRTRRAYLRAHPTAPDDELTPAGKRQRERDARQQLAWAACMDEIDMLLGCIG